MWCKRAKAAPASDAFYTEHVANTRRLNKQDQLDAVAVEVRGRARRVASGRQRLETLSRALREADASVDTTPLLREFGELKDLAQSLVTQTTEANAKIDDLVDPVAFENYLMRNRMTIDWSASENCDRRLGAEIRVLDGRERYYLLSVRARERSHVVALVSTKGSEVLFAERVRLVL